MMIQASSNQWTVNFWFDGVEKMHDWFGSPACSPQFEGCFDVVWDPQNRSRYSSVLFGFVFLPSSSRLPTLLIRLYP